MQWLSEQILNFMLVILNECLKVGMSAFMWAINFIYQPVLMAVRYMYSLLPTGWQKDMSALTPYINAADHWFPIDFGAQLVAMYIIWVLSYTSARFLIRMIRGA